ncbi:PepSY-associated TM helix domain-containing protein [Niastella populi]|uniref:Peptidase M4 n=1 Tax=Niastella populi TaxID=550983 RepID=A0A1V9FJQ8_9BACT|nr:PepSY-associated TM helix domain-containing protein [Niastella populi]OQP58560.1 peptidase M4 [Niastella populi]
MTIKKIIGKVHLWLGFTSGIIVFVIAVTGCLYAFQAEISELTQSSYRKVAPQQAPFLLPSQMKAIAEKQLPGKHLHSVQYGLKDRAAVATFYSFTPQYYYTVYINPYSGEVLKVKNMDRDFFRIVLMGHYYLWLPEAVGQQVAIYSTIIFVVMMISGLILWWPRNKAAAKQRFSIKWSAAWRRKNYDLHNVLGFYMTWVAIILAITGLVFGWQLLANAIYKTAGGKKSLTYVEPLSDTTKITIATAGPVDKLWQQMQQEHKDAETIEMHFGAEAKSSLEVAINTDADTYWKSDYRFFDQYTMKELPVDHIYGRFKDAKGADKLLRMNYDIHTGAILGLPGKILAFFASLIAASLPITGFMIWWGRRKKKPLPK